MGVGVTAPIHDENSALAPSWIEQRHFPDPNSLFFSLLF